MTAFDSTKAYAAQEEEFFDDGREIQLLHYIYEKPDIDEIRGSPERVLAAIDEYGRKKKYLMNVGEDKGKIVTDLIAEVKPQVMVELGGYIGYSTILFASAVRAAGGKRFYSLERNPEFASVILGLVNLAGLADFVRVEVGPSDAGIRRLHASGGVQNIDMMFLDHYKPAYTSDLKLCESLKLIKPGSVLAADNVIKPGNPKYLAYVRATVEQKRQAAANGEELQDTASNGHMPERTEKQYKKRVDKEQVDESVKGNPNLVYESKLVNSFEPTGEPDGVEITRCTAEDN